MNEEPRCWVLKSVRKQNFFLPQQFILGYGIVATFLLLGHTSVRTRTSTLGISWRLVDPPLSEGKAQKSPKTNHDGAQARL